ncbi:MAG: hypothetical protein RL722_2560 [Pseudomonadota bacterium]|jgi:hypothetical protein
MSPARLLLLRLLPTLVVLIGLAAAAWLQRDRAPEPLRGWLRELATAIEPDVRPAPAAARPALAASGSSARTGLQPVEARPPGAVAAGRVGAASAAVTASATSRPAGGVRKCRRGNAILYTDGDCPPGSGEVGMSEQAAGITVVPGPSLTQKLAGQAASLSASPGASRATVRGLLAPDDGVDLRARAMERVIEGR